MLGEPLFEGASYERIAGGGEELAVVEVPGEATLEGFRERGGGEEGDIGLAEEMVEGLDTGCSADRGIGQDEVQLLDGQVGEESFGRVLVADQVDVLLGGEDRGENTVHDELGQQVGRSDAEAAGFGAADALEVFEELLSEGEDFLGIVEGELSAFRELEAAGVAFEEGFAELFFQELELFGDGGLGEVEGAAGAVDAAFLDDRPEVAEVVVIEPVHVEVVYRQYLSKRRN